MTTQWLEGVKCACGEDDFKSVPAPRGTHTLTTCTTDDEES